MSLFSVMQKAVVLTTSSLSMAAESLSPVALNSKTLATGPLQHKHVKVLFYIIYIYTHPFEWMSEVFVS